MTSELVIVFLYDCDLCKSEEDDPQDAIVYFYPTWVSNEQRHALCSQLMGVTQFFTNSFSLPSVIALQSGKFAVCKTGRFALVVGTDRSIPDSLLRRRMAYLCDIIRLFHYSIESIELSLNDDDDLTDKLSQLLQTYLPIVLDGANLFDNLPLFKFPNNRACLVDDAQSFLESMQKSCDVLGGAVLYQNKVVYSQLLHALSKLIILAHPYKVKIPDCNVPTSFHLPSGVQLLNIYLKNEEAQSLDTNERVDESSVKESKVNSVLPRKSTPCECSANGLSCDTGLSVTEENSLQNRSGRTTTDDEGSSSDGFGAGKDGVPDLVLDAVRARQLVRMSKISKRANIMNAVPGQIPTSKTADDIHAINNIPMSFSFRCFSIGLPKIKASWTDRKRPESSKKLWFNTICDPKYPLFKSNGLPASYSLFSQSDISSSLVPNGKTKKNHRDLSNERPAKRESWQLSLSLSKYSERPPPKDAPLTPLMAKLALSIVADEISEPIVADEMTESIDNFVPNISDPKNFSSSEPSSLLVGLNIPKKVSGPEKNNDSTSQHSMFVYGRNSTYVVLVLKGSAEINSTLIESLWERTNEYLKKVDDELDKVVEETSSSWCTGAEISSAGEYSYAVVDGNWGPVERGGFYRPHQIQMVTSLHETLLSLPQVVDILVREEDSVTYGYRCDSSQIFYQQHCSQNLGVPTPADLMGVIPWKAKSVIQRDHHVMAA